MIWLICYVIGLLITFAAVATTTDKDDADLWERAAWSLGWPLWLAGLLVAVIGMIALSPFVLLYRSIRRRAPSPTPHQEPRG